MTERKIPRQRVEFGDFQTPLRLARDACSLLWRNGVRPASVLEPTCGQGSFLVAALERFPGISSGVGLDINGDYVEIADQATKAVAKDRNVMILHDDFFEADWKRIVESLPEPLLVVGNPPWVTNAELGHLRSSNLPMKSNYENRRGIDAVTGKSNFDISEWMLLRALEWIDGRRATLAMLCKTTVARKVLLHGWRNGFRLKESSVYLIDASKHFNAAVDACFFVVSTSPRGGSCDCRVFETLEDDAPATVFGCRDRRMVANVSAFERWQHLQGEERYRWRSGIKHDCSRVMELRWGNGRFRNGLDQLVDIESDSLFPMLKSSEIASPGDVTPSRSMLVTQRSVGESTKSIREIAPKTWAYLMQNAELLDRRGSSIYRKRPRFSIFGVGEYSFAPWKVAVSGFYKRFHFRVVGPHQGKPVVLDDTCYFIACDTKDEAEYIGSLLNSAIAKEFFSAFVFWDAKRPITVELLRRLDLIALASELGSEEILRKYLAKNASRGRKEVLPHPGQGLLFDVGGVAS